jgi:hypothetical protein
VTPTQGIFLSIPIGGVRHIVRIAGLAHNRHVDPGELLFGTDDRGQDFAFDGKYLSSPTGQARAWEIGSLDADSRVGVAVSQLGYATVTFVGTDTLGGSSAV